MNQNNHHPLKKQNPLFSAAVTGIEDLGGIVLATAGKYNLNYSTIMMKIAVKTRQYFQLF